MSKEKIDPENLTLDETWTYQLRMSKWIAEQIKNGSEKLVARLKQIWIKESKFNPEHFSAACFFCTRNNGEACCRDCPGCLVDPEFNCMDPAYNFEAEPEAFYQKLLELNSERISDASPAHNLKTSCK